MILKYLSIPEINFSESWRIGWEKIDSLSKFDKYMTLFWLLGPFIYLIERSPADIWLTLLGISFLFRCFKKKDWSWLNQWWVKSVLLFWAISIYSSIIGPDPQFSLGRAVVWIRFPLYAAAAQIWLAKDKDIRFVMLISMFFGSIIMMFFISFEFFYHPSEIVTLSPKGRLTGPYGDHVPGGYFAKVCLPLFCFSIALINSDKKLTSIMCVIFCSLLVAHTIMTGERTHVLILIFSSILALLVWKFKIKKFLILFTLILSIFTLFFLTYGKELTFRFSSGFINSIPFNTSHDNPYWGAWRSGIQQGMLTPFLGIGANGTRKTCKNLPFTPELPGKNYCGNHPHNFYIQFFAETGLVGLIFGIFMCFTIIKCCWNARYNRDPDIMSYVAFIIPLAILFPIQNHGNFFGQWGNLFVWFAIGLAISNNQNWFKNKELRL